MSPVSWPKSCQWPAVTEEISLHATKYQWSVNIIQKWKAEYLGMLRCYDKRHFMTPLFESQEFVRLKVGTGDEAEVKNGKETI